MTDSDFAAFDSLLQPSTQIDFVEVCEFESACTNCKRRERHGFFWFLGVTKDNRKLPLDVSELGDKPQVHTTFTSFANFCSHCWNANAQGKTAEAGT